MAWYRPGGTPLGSLLAEQSVAAQPAQCLLDRALPGGGRDVCDPLPERRQAARRCVGEHRPQDRAAELAQAPRIGGLPARRRRGRRGGDPLPRAASAQRAHVAARPSRQADRRADIEQGVADAKKLENDARSKALSDARDKASELAKLAGRTVGEIISIGDEPSTVYDYDGVRASRGKSPTKYVAFSNEPIEITSNLRVTFELKK